MTKYLSAEGISTPFPPHDRTSIKCYSMTLSEPAPAANSAAEAAQSVTFELDVSASDQWMNEWTIQKVTLTDDSAQPGRRLVSSWMDCKIISINWDHNGGIPRMLVKLSYKDAHLDELVSSSAPGTPAPGKLPGFNLPTSKQT